jgi:hypothetical protein
MALEAKSVTPATDMGGNCMGRVEALPAAGLSTPSQVSILIVGEKVLVTILPIQRYFFQHGPAVQGGSTTSTKDLGSFLGGSALRRIVLAPVRFALSAIVGTAATVDKQPGRVQYRRVFSTK